MIPARIWCPAVAHSSGLDTLQLLFLAAFSLGPHAPGEFSVAPMSASSEPLITREEELALHKRLVNGDDTASADIANLFFDGLVDWLIAINRATVAEELCIQAAEDAWIALITNPASFKPERGKRLGEYLRMSAQGDLRNVLQKEGKERKKSLELVQLSDDDGKYLETDDDPSLPLQIQEAAERTDDGVNDGLSEKELRVRALMQCGERKTAVFADALGINHLEKKEKAAEVQRVKNKIKKRISRGKTDDGQTS
jgi:hypothetical protein